MSRKEVLGAIRNSLGAKRAHDIGRRTAAQARLSRHERHLIPARARLAKTESVQRFASELTRNAADVIRVASRDDIPSAILLFLDQLKMPRRLRHGDHPLLGSLPWGKAPELEVSHGTGRDEDGAALSHALAGVSETGSLVLASGPENPVSLAFLSEVHLVAIAESAIVGALEDAVDLMRAAYGTGAMPRSLNFISGPSRTGDIGGRIVLGAHGPRRLAVIIYADAPAPAATD